MSSHPWSLLGIEPTAETSAIRKAYAERLKAMNVDEDVAAYARLRQARDLALRLARTMDEGDFETAGAEDADETAPTPDAVEPEAVQVTATPIPTPPATPRWTFAAPELPGEWQDFEDPAARPLATRPGEPDASTMLERMAWAAAAAREAGHGGVSGAGIPLTTIDPFTAPLLSGSLVGDDALGLRPGETPAERLTILLDPERENAGEPLTEAETRQATRALRTILDEVAQSHISRQQQIEDWLAEILARGWPRSAPLLEDSSHAFGWEREWSAHDARPAVQFLGARLRGYRFQQNVLQPDHRFHKAWNELAKPGKAGPLRMLGGPAQSDVDALLRGVRKHFPELESHFATERVASWEGGNPVLTGLLVVLGIVAFAIVVAIAGSSSPSPQQPPAVNPSEAARTAEVSSVMDGAAREAFGEGHDSAWLWKTQPDLARSINAVISGGLRAGDDRDAMIDKAVAIVRLRSYLKGRELSGDLFETAMQLRLAQLRAARKDSIAACEQLGNSGWFEGPLPLTADERASERAFALQLARQNALGQPKGVGQHSAMIPGELIGKVIKTTKLSQADVVAAMQGKSSDANRCAVSIALLEQALGWHGDNRREILMTL
ncbi:hypothetical protein WBP06_11120 [Novosphingobium sp. BL-8H]|uniref:hypothetical protein n=1 Tax=Novosphingobium sp. BL-8H TaxID=3127640 RepID=UPI0037580676